MRRRRFVMAASILSATSGFRRTKARKSSRGKTASRASSTTVALAERGLPSSIDISPKKSPRASSASVTSSPSASTMCMRTRPLSIRYSASPASPARKRGLPAVLCSASSSERSAPTVSSSRDAKSGTERIDSSVMGAAVVADIGVHLSEENGVRARTRARALAAGRGRVRQLFFLRRRKSFVFRSPPGSVGPRRACARGD